MLLGKKPYYHFLRGKDQLNNKMLDMEEFCQFPFRRAANGCHILVQCPAKKYDYFNKIYSIILMAMVDAKYRHL